MLTGRLRLLPPLLLGLAIPALSLGVEPEPPGPPQLTVDLGTAAAVAGGELGLVGLSLLLQDQLAAPACRWCRPPQLDRWARGQLRWTGTRTASTASDALQLLVPAGAAATLWIQASPLGQRQLAEDLVVLAEAASTALLLTQGVKYAVGRLRPDAWARGTSASADDKLSFWSGHTSFAFSAAAGATQIARLRGRPGWRWLAAASFGAAALTGYLRVAADRHWLTDVAAGAVVGTATGLAVPLLAFQPADGRAPGLTLAPAPGGVAILF
jgi:membrane-associated phospholipid phosphatase